MTLKELSEILEMILESGGDANMPVGILNSAFDCYDLLDGVSVRITLTDIGNDRRLGDTFLALGNIGD